MKLPTIPDRGLTRRGRAFVQQCLDYMQSITPVAGAGTSVRQLKGGTQINSDAVTGGSLIVTLCQNRILHRFSLVGRDLGEVEEEV